MKRTETITSVGALLLALLVPSAAGAAKPPVGRTYFVVSIGVATDASEAYDEAARCLTFTRTEVCDATSCGTWRRVASPDKGKKQGSIEFQFVLVDDETGEPLEIAGRADVDSRGRKSALGGAATGRESATGRVINIALGGRAVGTAACQRLAEEHQSGN